MKDFKKSCHAFKASQQGSGVVVVLVVIVAAAAGILGFIAGQKAPVNNNLVVSAPAPAVVSGEVASGTEQPNPVIAKVNGADIKRQEIIDLVNAMPPQMRQMPLPQLFPMALEQAISNKIVDRKAAMSGLEKDKDVQKQLWQAKEQIIRAKYVENAINDRIDDARIKSKYEEYLKNFPDVEEVKAAHILVEDEKTAKAIIARLNKGEAFADLAKENSKDGSAENGGELGYFTKTEVVPEFANVAFATEAGTYAKAPVKSEFGFHVIRVDEKRKRPAAEFDKIKPFIKQELQRSVLEEVLAEWKAASNIERFDVNGKPLPTAEQQAAAAAAEPQAGAPASADAAASAVEAAAGDAAK